MVDIKKRVLELALAQKTYDQAIAVTFGYLQALLDAEKIELKETVDIRFAVDAAWIAKCYD